MDVLILLTRFLPLSSLLCTLSSRLLGVAQGETTHPAPCGERRKGERLLLLRAMWQHEELQLGMVVSAGTKEGLVPHLRAFSSSRCCSTEWRHLVCLRTPTDTALLADHSSGSPQVLYSGVWRGRFHPGCNLLRAVCMGELKHHRE